MTLPSSGVEHVWRQADQNVFVATLHAEYAGFTDDTPAGIHAHGAHGEDLGVHRTSALARAAVAAASTAVSAPPGHPRRVRRRRFSRGGNGRRAGERPAPQGIACESHHMPTARYGPA